MMHDHLPNIFESYSDQGNGPVVVLLHALLLDHSMFSHQSESLSKQGFRVLTPSYAGHGRSNRLHGEPSVEAMADQVFTMLDQLQITEPVILGGLSMGGYVAFAAWKKFQDRIRGLILMNTRAVPDTTEEAANRLRACTLIRQAKSQTYGKKWPGFLTSPMLRRLAMLFLHFPHVLIAGRCLNPLMCQLSFLQVKRT